MAAHATIDELENYIGTTAPDDADRLLQRASELVDTRVFGFYEIDSVTDLPADARVREALRDATCAQVEWWLATGDEKEATARFAFPGIGSLNLRTTGRRIAPRAADHLRLAGLLQVVPA
jgi:hypothetical protein